MDRRKKLYRIHPGDTGVDCLKDATPHSNHVLNGSQAKIEILGNEIIEKRVKACANSGRVYLPPEWIGRKVKIIRID